MNIMQQWFDLMSKKILIQSICISMSLLIHQGVLADDSDEQNIIDKKIDLVSKSTSKDLKSIDDLMVDTAQGNISASTMLGISADAVSVVENTKGFVAAVTGAATSGQEAGFSIAPGRTSLLPMSLPTYASGIGSRLLGNLTISYAQGPTNINDIEYERRAVSLETSATFSKEEDPILAAALQCDLTFVLSPPGEPVEEFRTRQESKNKEYISCVEGIQKRLSDKSWNISRFSISLASGDIKSSNTRDSLGTTAILGISYGFKENIAISGVVRHSMDEPVLDTLGTGSKKTKDNTMAALRITIGSERMRGLAEVSNADTNEVTVSQRVFQYAAGFDIRVSDGIWFGFRGGKRAKIDGKGEETATLLNLSFSPSSSY